MLRKIKKCRSPLIAVLVSAPFVFATAQPQLDLSRCYDHDRVQDETFQDIYLSAAGDYLLCGMTGYRAWVQRIDRDGNITWERLIGDGVLYSLIETDNGDIVVAGSLTGSLGAARFSADGDSIWQRRYQGGSGECRAVIELKDGDFALCGREDQRGFVMRIDGNGASTWRHQYGVQDRKTCLYALRETDEAVVAAGESYAHDGIHEQYGWVVKVNQAGEFDWLQTYMFNDIDIGFYSIVSTPGGFALGGMCFTQWNWGVTTLGYCLTFIGADGALRSINPIPPEAWFCDHCTGMVKLLDGGFAFTGWTHQLRGGGHYPLLIRTNRNGQFMWLNRFDNLVEMPQSSPNALNSVVADGAQIIAVGTLYREDNEVGSDAWIVRCEPDDMLPQIFHKEPEDSLLYVLIGDTVRFIVRARDRQGREQEYSWTVNDTVVGDDTTLVHNFNFEGEIPVVCRVFNDDAEIRVTWAAIVRDFFIASYFPDTLFLALRRGTSQTFSIDSVAVVAGDPVEYEWTLTNLDNFEREDAGEDVGVTVEFLRSGNYQMEGLANRGESSDNVIWTIQVRSAILDFWPRELNLSVPPDSSGEFGVIPFNPESDSLSYRWEVDGDSVGSDSTVTLRFVWDDRRIGNPPHLVAAIVMDGMEGDTVRWEVTVREPDEVGKWASEQVDKWGLLSVSPNPFNSTTTIRYHIPSAGQVRLTLHDLIGREVRVCESANLQAGIHTISVDTEALPAGIYLVRLETEKFQAVRKIVLLR